MDAFVGLLNEFRTNTKALIKEMQSLNKNISELRALNSNLERLIAEMEKTNRNVGRFFSTAEKLKG